MYTVFSISLYRRLSSIAFNASSVQSIAFSQGRVCSIHSQRRSVLAGLQSTAFTVCPLSSVSVVFSLVFTNQWGSESIAFSDSSVSVAFRVCTVQWVIFRLYSSVSVAFRVCTVQWVILRLYSSVSAVFRALAVHQESVMFMPCSESTP